MCGKQYKLLNHLHLKKHGLTPETYKEKFGLNRTHPLASGDLKTYLKENSTNKDTARYLEGHRLSDPGATTRGKRLPRRPEAIPGIIEHNRRIGEKGGLRHPKARPDITREMVLALYSEGLSVREIADKLGCSERIIRRRLRVAGVEKLRPGRRPERKDR